MSENESEAALLIKSDVEGEIQIVELSASDHGFADKRKNLGLDFLGTLLFGDQSNSFLVSDPHIDIDVGPSGVQHLFQSIVENELLLDGGFIVQSEFLKAVKSQHGVDVHG